MSDMRILALETATEACSAALLINAEVIQRYEIAPRRHVALILPFVDQLLAEAGIQAGQLDAVAFGRGPGSFTGLRIAAGITQGIAFGADVPVAPVSTLAALAQGAVREHGVQAVLAALDARMQEVYWGAYRVQHNGLVGLEGDECVSAPHALTLPQGDDWSAAGEGWGSYREALLERLPFEPGSCFETQMPQARDVALLATQAVAAGTLLPAAQAAPVYLRDQVATKPQSRVKNE